MIEIWRDVVGYDGKYQVSNLGRVRSFHKGGRILKPGHLNRGYLFVQLFRDSKGRNALVHRLVAAAFIPNPENKPTVNHINGIKTDNRVENLEWCTYSENEQHAVTAGLMPQGNASYQAKLTDEQVCYVRDNPDGLSCAELARRFGVASSTIGKVQRGERYRNANGVIRDKINTRIPDDIREQIRAEYKPRKHGHNCRALAKKFGVSTYVIWRAVHEDNN